MTVREKQREQEDRDFSFLFFSLIDAMFSVLELVVM